MYFIFALQLIKPEKKMASVFVAFEMATFMEIYDSQLD